MKKLKNNYIIILIVLLVISAIGSVLCYYSISSWGPGLGPDSAAYIAGAKNISNGNGIVTLFLDKDASIPLRLWASSQDINDPLIFHWPPFYPIFLSVFDSLNLDLVTIAGILNTIIFGLNVFLSAAIVFYVTKNIIYPVLLSLFFISSNVLLGVHSWVMSEGLFLLTGLAGLFLLIIFLNRKKPIFIMISAIFTSMSFMTRYIGLAFVITSIFALIFLYKDRIKKKIALTFSYSFITLDPMAWWVYLTARKGSGLTDRRFFYHPLSIEELREIPKVINNWFFISFENWIVNLIIAFLIIATIVFLGFFLLRKRDIIKNNIRGKNLLAILFILSLSYFLILLLSRIFFDAKIPVAQDRLLFPIYLSVITSIFLIPYIFISVYKKKFFKYVIYAFLVLFISVNAFYGYRWLYENHENGQGYSTEYIIESTILQDIRELPMDKLIYSDATDVIYLFTQRPAYVIPSVYDPYTLRENTEFDDQLRDMFSDIKNKDGVLVDFGFLERPFLPHIEWLKQEEDICPVDLYEVGMMYKVCPESGKLLVLSDNSNFSDYWLALNQSEFIYKPEEVMVKVHGDDPWFESRFDLSPFKTDELYISMALEVESASQARIFFGRDSKDYLYEDSYSYPLDIGLNEIVFKLIRQENVEKIRIDPIDKDEDCSIINIKLFSVEH